MLNFLDIAVAIPEAVMRSYGWGGIKNASILVNYQGCQTIREWELQEVIKKETQNLQCSKQDSVYRIDNIEILSTIGENYYLRYQNKAEKITSKFTLSKAAVLSWGIQVSEEVKSEQK